MKKIYVQIFLIGLLFIFSNTSYSQVFFNATVGSEFSPGVFGQLNVGNAPPPPVIYTQPMVGGPSVYGAPPMYVYAPIEEIQNWGYFCGKYSACGMPVYFIHYDERHPYWARYHEAYRVPFRGGERMEERREPMRDDRDRWGRGDLRGKGERGEIREREERRERDERR